MNAYIILLAAIIVLIGDFNPVYPIVATVAALCYRLKKI